MAKDPAFLFYPNDYLGGTMGMSFEEKGAYMELLMLQFNRGHMTTDMIGQVVGQIWDKIKEKFVTDENGLWYNQRLETEINKRKSFVDSRKNNLSGANQYTKKEGRMDGHMTSHTENENKDIIKEGGMGETKSEKPPKQTVEDFYREQIKLSDNDQTYKKTVEFLLGLLPDSSRCDNILGLKEQLTFEQFKKVKDVVARSGTSISELLIGMENKKDLQKKYKSVNLTMQGWARLEGKRSNNFKQKADAQRY